MLSFFRSASVHPQVDLPSGKDVLDRYQPRIHTDANGKALPYRLFKPDQDDPRRRYPLILFLHGAGGRGNDNQAQILDGERTAVAFASPAIQAQYASFILAPQCPADQRWVEVDWAADAHAQPAEPADPLRLTLELLCRLQQEFSIDPQRLYLTGLSMGGFGTWDLITRHPDLFAAAVPVCGGADETQARRILHLPIWAFHGAKDLVVRPLRSRNIISALRRLGASPIYTEYPAVDHHCWLNAYAEPDLLPWLFAQKRAGN